MSRILKKQEILEGYIKSKFQHLKITYFDENKDVYKLKNNLFLYQSSDTSMSLYKYHDLENTVHSNCFFELNNEMKSEDIIQIYNNIIDGDLYMYRHRYLNYYDEKKETIMCSNVEIVRPEWDIFRLGYPRNHIKAEYFTKIEEDKEKYYDIIRGNGGYLFDLPIKSASKMI